MNIPITHPGIELYCQEHSSEQSELLHELERFTHLNTLQPRMLSSGVQGRILSLLCKMMSPKFIVEIGTFTGYSTLCLAEGLPEDGRILTLEMNGEMEEIFVPFFEKSEFKEKISYQIGDASAILKTIKDPIDLVFMDADKDQYLDYYETILPKLRPGGIILADNVLWSGKIIKDELKDRKTSSLRAFNDHVMNDSRVEKVLLPIRDGIYFIRKK